MAYSADQKPSGLTELTALASDDTIIVGDTSDTSEVVKKITRANLATDLTTDFATAAQGALADSASQPGHTHTASEITDFDIEVANNSAVAANTAARHDPVTVTDSDDIDFTLTAQDLTGVLKATAISSKTLDTLAGTEELLVNDAGTLKKTTAQDIADLGGAGVSDGDKGDITVSGSGSTWTVDNDAITYAKMQNVSATDRLLGRDTAGAGDVEELTPTAVRTMLNVADGANAYVHPNHSGDVTSVADGATTIANDVVTNAKLANVATATIKGRSTAGTGDPEDLTATQVRTLINVEDGADVTDTTNVTAAGALMDSELADITAIKTLQAPDNTTISTFGASLVDDTDAATARTTLGLVIGTDVQAQDAGLQQIADLADPNADRILFWDDSAGAYTYLTAGTGLTITGTTINASGGSGTYFNDTYVDQSGGTSDTYGVLSGTINGSNTTFTVSQGAYLSGSLKVYLNGQLQTQGTSEDWDETTPASGTFDFNTAPVSGDLITVEYQVQSLSSDTVITDADIAIDTPADGHILIYDGVTDNKFENKAVTGDVTLSAAGVTAIASGVIVNADINASAAIDATKIHDGSVSNTEFGYIGGLTSDAQTQLNAKAPIANPTFTGEIGIGAVNVSETELGILEGATVTTTELNYVDGVTSSIQTQLDSTLKTTTAQEYTGTKNFNATTLSDGATINWDASANQVTSVTLGGNRTMAAPTNLVDGATYVLSVIQDGTGSRTITWNSVFKWPGGTAPTLTTTASARDIITFVSDGTNLYGVSQLNFS